MTRGVLFAAATAFGLALIACAEDEGKTPSCPDLDLYDIREYPDIDPAAIQKRDEAAAKGCVTGPGSATLPGTGGSAGAASGGAGSGGAAGSGGSAGASAGAGGT